MSDDLTRFLLARIAEDEAEVSGVSTGWHLEAGDGGDPENPINVVEIGSDRLLAECAAKRRIVELHALTDPTATISGRPAPRVDEECGLLERDGPCLTMLWLAVPYAAHADYREAWWPPHASPLTRPTPR